MSRTFVVGDIHGCYDELMQLTAQIGLKEDDMLISVGDIKQWCASLGYFHETEEVIIVHADRAGEGVRTG